DARVRFQFAFTLGQASDPRAVSALASIAKRDTADDYIRTAILTSSYNNAAQLAHELGPDPDFYSSAPGSALIEELARIVGGRSESSEIESMLATAFKLHNQEFQQAIVIGL